MATIIKGIPTTTELKSSYFELYTQIINALSDDFDDSELITYSVKTHDSTEIIYQFYINGLRKVVLGELLNKINTIDSKELYDFTVRSLPPTAQIDMTKFYSFLKIVDNVKELWTDETKFNHEHK